MKSKIARMIDGKFFGFIKGPSSSRDDYFFHAADVIGNYEELKVQDEVEFEEEETNKGLRARNVRKI